MPKNVKINSFQEQYEILNDEQKTAVDIIDGALLVLAGPGTGKTQLLSVRAANIIRKKKAVPEDILILTFSNAAASAMRERLSRIIGYEGYNVVVETFHSFANSIVLESEDALKYVKDKIEIGEIERIKAFEYIMDNVKGVEPLRPFGAPYIHRREIEKRISELKNEGILPTEFKNSLKGLCPDGINLEEKHVLRLKALALIYENYEKLKDEKGAVLFDERGRIDYDDMILVALDALSRERALRKSFRKQYKYVMVDEFQDTNGAQLELLFSILDPARPNICCVGDDDQAIYRFQGATLANFRRLKEKIPTIRTVELRMNYRSTKEIIGLSRQIITQLPQEERLSGKELVSRRDYVQQSARCLEFRTEEEELNFVVEEIKKQAEIIKRDGSLSPEERKKPYNNIAVLLRRRSQILKIVDAFLRAGIPYATDGEEDIRSEKGVRQMLDVLELSSVDTEDNRGKSLPLYKVLMADYTGIKHGDVLKFIGAVNSLRRVAGKKGVGEYMSVNLFREFLGSFPADREKMPSKKESSELKVSKELKLTEPHAMHKMAWAINRLIGDARNRPAHDLLLQYINDTTLYRYILRKNGKDKVLRIRELRSLASFINMIKESDLADPALSLDDFMDELALRKIHGMPLKGKLATLSQDGVRLYTAHASKGLEFYSVFLPFCLQGQSWPVRRKGETIPLPPDICKSKERLTEKRRLNLLNTYDELRLFYVASTRAKANLIYTVTPKEKSVMSQFLDQIKIRLEDGSPIDEEKFLVEFLKKDKSRKYFEDEPAILKDMVADLTLDPTSLNNFIACRRKFLYNNVFKLPGRKNQHLVFGNCVHKALEDVYAIYMDEKKFPNFSFFEKLCKKELEFQGVNREIKTWCLAKLVTLEEWYKAESRLPVMPLGLENKLEIALADGLLFKGTFDKIEKDREGGLRVVDYKTGKPDKHVKAMAKCRDLSMHECDDYYRQLVAYKLLYERSRPKDEKELIKQGVLQFLEPVAATVKKYDLEKGTYRNIVAELTDGMVSDLEKVIIKCWRNIQELRFERLPERDAKERCSRCDFDAICWSDG
ncbi:MAG: ATP-dependent DNA helicase [Candidatus Omnitrophota bacterium]